MSKNKKSDKWARLFKEAVKEREQRLNINFDDSEIGILTTIYWIKDSKIPRKKIVAKIKEDLDNLIERKLYTN